MQLARGKRRHLLRWLLAASLAIPAVVGVSQPADAQTDRQWIGTWASGLQAQLPPAERAQDSSDTGENLFGPLPRIQDQTLRQIVRVSAGGSRVRVALTNAFGTQPLEIGAAHVALRSQDAGLRPGTGATVTFDGRSSTVIEPGSIVLSDPVALDVAPLAEIAIDVHLPGNPWENRSPATGLRAAWTTNYLSERGDHTGHAAFPTASTFGSWLYLSRVEVEAPAGTPVVVTLGDSITEGFGSTADTYRRWPDVLASRLAATDGDRAPAVLNVAISGNRILRGNDGVFGPLGVESDDPLNPNAGFGPSALDRFDRDVLLQPGVTHVVVLESINDIGMTSDPSTPTAADLIAGHRALVQRARAQGLTIYAGTLTPFEGAVYFTEEGEAKRQAVNSWLRTSGIYDAIIDFDAVVRDSRAPRRFLPMYHPGDWLHPNDAGYRAMGEAIDLTLFASEHAATAVSAR